MQEPPDPLTSTHDPAERRTRELGSAPLHPTFERGETQADERPQQPRSPLDAPELDPQWQVDVAGGPELANHPAIDRRIHWMPRSRGMRRMALVTPSRFHQLTRSGLNSSST